MLLEIRDAEGKFLGKLDLTRTPPKVMEGVAIFERFVQVATRDGITATRDVYNSHSKAYMVFEQPVGLDDPGFAFAMRDFLRRSGFAVRQLHPEAEQEIKNLLKDFPDTPDKKEILERLPSMSYHEQTFILGQLKKEKSSL